MARVLFLGGLGRSGTTLRRTPARRTPRRVRARRGGPPLAARRARRRALRLRLALLRLRLLAARSASTPSAAGTNVDVDRVHALRDTVERTRHIPRLASAGRRPRRGTRIRRVLRPGLHRGRRGLRRAGDRRLLQALRARPRACAARRRRGPAGGARGTGRAGRRVLLDQAVTRPETDGTDEMTRYSPGRSALLWTAHNAAFSLLARRGVRGTPDPLRGVRSPTRAARSPPWPSSPA